MILTKKHEFDSVENFEIFDGSVIINDNTCLRKICRDEEHVIDNTKFYFTIFKDLILSQNKNGGPIGIIILGDENSQHLSRPDGKIIEFEVPKSIDIQMKEAAVPQYKATQNLLNQNGNPPKVVDPTQPGDPFELSSHWHQLIEKNYIRGSAKIINYLWSI